MSLSRHLVLQPRPAALRALRDSLLDPTLSAERAVQIAQAIVELQRADAEDSDGQDSER